jgi:hypothetical protein
MPRCRPGSRWSAGTSTSITITRPPIRLVGLGLPGGAFLLVSIRAHAAQEHSYLMACHPRRGKVSLAAQAAMDESRSCPNLGSHPRWTQVHKQVSEDRYGISRPMRWS